MMMNQATIPLPHPAVVLWGRVGDLTIDATLKEGAMTTHPRCDACGMPMTQPSQHAKGNPQSRYCLYCTNIAGHLKSREDIREGMIQYVMKLEDWPREKAAVDVERKMATLPAWTGAA